MDDDMVKDRLRRLAAVEPPVAVDHAHVLQTGRRRRLARRAGTTAVALAIAFGAVPAMAMLGPNSNPSPPPAAPVPAETSTQAPRALVDHEAGTITLPTDEVRGDPRDSAVVSTAYRHFMSDCMAEQGFGELWSFDGPVQQPEWMNLPYGAWREGDVREVGYGPLLEKLVGAEGARSIEGPESEALGACTSAVIDAGLSFDVAALQEELRFSGGWRSASDTDEGRAVREEWTQCLADSGVQEPTEEMSWLPEGVRDAPFEEQVRIGLIDVACKERLDIVQRMGDLDTALQAAHLEQEAEYYAAFRARDREVLETAQEYLTEHAISVD